MTKIVTEKQAAARMLLIRRGNVKRHNENSARINLRTSQIQKQKVQTMQMELDRFHEAAVRGSGLDAVRINRMNTLKQIIGKYK
jgi:hypothetical protein